MKAWPWEIVHPARWETTRRRVPTSQRFWVQIPHPVITRERLRRVLDPQARERILEIGPGIGYYTVDMAEWVGPEGTVEIFDLQREFLDHTMRRARERGLSNVVPTQGDATNLPYDNDSMDAVVLVGVLGETHFTTSGSLQGQCGDVGLPLGDRSGSWFACFARFAAGKPRAEAPAAARDVPSSSETPC